MEQVEIPEEAELEKQTALRDSQERFQALVAASSQIVWTTDADGVVVEDSPSWRAFTGQSWEEYREFGSLDVIHPDDREPTLEVWVEALRSGTTMLTEFRLRHVSGEWRWVSSRAVPLFDTNGRIRGWVGMNTDVTMRKKAEEQERDRSLQTLADSIPHLVWIAGPDAWVFWYNRRWYEYTGTTPEQMQGLGWKSVHDPQLLPQVLQAWDVSVAKGEPFELEFPLRGADGNFRWFLTRVAPVRDANGSVTRWYGTNTDVDALRSATNAVRASEQRLRIVTDNVRLGLAVVSREHSYIFTNQAYAEILSLPFTELVGLRVADVMRQVYDEQIRPRLEQAFKGETVAFELALPHHSKRGGRRYSVIYEPSTDTDGAPVAVVVIFDITERVQAEEALRRSNQDLEQFAYAASHDLQEPLRMVATYTQLLAKKYKGQLDGQADQYIGYAVEGAKRMGTLLDGLLQYSRAGEAVKTLSPADAEAVFKQTLEDLRTSIADTEAVITSDRLPGTTIPAVHLLELFQNLLGNALKYRREEPPRIHVSARTDGEWNHFAVTDNGIGVKPEYAQHIFGVFRRLHADRYKGTGIGLAICKRIVERWGGRIWVDPEFAAGARFCFTLPAISKEHE